MAIVIGKIKCCLCNKKEGVIKSVHDYGIYGDVGGRIYFHPECLEIVQIHPRKFDNRIVDKAVNIIDLMNENNHRFNDHIIEQYEKKIQQLETSHFENMIPRKKRA